jgi:outer membrane protein assembly factor BamB
MDDGRMLWTRELGAASRFAPAIDGMRAVFAVDDSRAVALRLEDGRVEWEQKLDGMLNQPSFARDRIFIGSNTNFLFALDNATGRIAWKWKTGGDVIGTAADSKGGAYYASLDNVVRAAQPREWESALDQGDSHAASAASESARRWCQVRRNRRPHWRDVGD